MSTYDRTCEFISPGHPDKVCDAISDALLDRLLSSAAAINLPGDSIRAAVETLAKENLVVVSGEIGAPREVLSQINMDEIVNSVWDNVGYAHQGRPTVINYVKPQSREIAQLVDGDGVAAGAGDQGIMCGYAHNGNDDYMPPEFVMARKLIAAMIEARESGEMAYLRSDAKSQVTLSPEGEILAVVISTQHSDDVELEELRADLRDKIIRPTLGDVAEERMKLNFKGSFVLGGSAADCGVTGRKIVADQYGPRSPVGGGAFSGKDPSKVDRSAAYMARHIAKTALVTEFGDAESVSVQLAYGIGQLQPSSILAHLDDGRDITPWVNTTFPDLSPRHIQERLRLWNTGDWTYSDTASMGHFGRDLFPWEKI